MEEKKPEEEKKEGEEKKVEAEKKGEDSDKKPQESNKDSKEDSAPAPPEAPAPPPPPQEIVLKVYMHCEGCARKVRRCLKGFEGTYKKQICEKKRIIDLYDFCICIYKSFSLHYFEILKFSFP